MNDHAVPAASEAAGFEFVLTREFDAPPELLFQLWTDCAHLKQWFGPRGFPMLKCDNDLRPGGRLHYCLETPSKEQMWGKWEYRVITPPEYLEVVTSFSDAQGGLARHPLSASWPLKTLSRTRFEASPAGTRMTLHWSAFEATPEETQTFYAGRESMKAGWGGTMQNLDEYLAKLRG